MPDRPENLTARISELIERGNLDELTIEVDRLADAGQWGGLFQLREQCRRALERGKQLWPVAANAEYRLALDAPGPWAGRMLVPGTGRFALGPLPEVAAYAHRWSELAADAPPGPVASMAAHERVLRGEDLTRDGRVDADVLEVPLVLQPWEPAYPVAEYTPHEAHFPAPQISRLPPPRALPDRPAVTLSDAPTRRALTELALAWTTESNGRAEAVGVEGNAATAVAALGLRRARVGEISAAEGLAIAAWAGASGGAHGRRRGMAPGRFAAWWAVAAVAGLTDAWPVPPDELGQSAEQLLWYAWDAAEPETGWSLHLAIEDPAVGVAWAVTAVDTA